MGVFTRMRDILNANVNAMLDKAENPEKMVKQILREMEDTLIEVKSACAGATASRKKIDRELEQIEAHAREWARRAELAVDRGRDDLAREALAEKRRYRQRADALLEELNQTDQLITQYRDDIQQLEDKLVTVRDRQRLLLQRHRKADVKRRAQTQLRQFDTADAMARFEAFEHRIERMEAEADLVNYGRGPRAMDELSRMQHDDEIERDLEALKAKRHANEATTATA